MKKQPWSISEARKHFATLVKSAVKEPQPVYHRDRLVAAVIDAETFEAFMRWREEQTSRTIGEAFEELRKLCRTEKYRLPTMRRADRANPFAEDDVS